MVCSDELFTTRRVSTLRSGGAQVVSSGAVRGVRERECASRAEAKRKQGRQKGDPQETKTFQRVAQKAKAKLQNSCVINT